MRTLTNNKPRKTWFFKRGKFEFFSGGWVGCCWVPKRDDARWSEKCMLRCNALKNGHLPERKVWALYRRVSELLLSPKEGWRRMKWKLYAEVQRPEKRAYFWEESLSSLPEGEWAAAEPQRRMTQRMRRVTTRQTKGIEKESINILFICIRKFFHSQVKTCKDSCKHLTMGRVQCSNEFFVKHLISKKA